MDVRVIEVPPVPATRTRPLWIGQSRRRFEEARCCSQCNRVRVGRGMYSFSPGTYRSKLVQPRSFTVRAWLWPHIYWALQRNRRHQGAPAGRRRPVVVPNSTDSRPLGNTNCGNSPTLVPDLGTTTRFLCFKIVGAITAQEIGEAIRCTRYTVRFPVIRRRRY